MPVKYEKEDQIFPGDHFSLYINLPKIGEKVWKGLFYSIAEESCQEIVSHSQASTPLNKSALIEYFVPKLSTKPRISELNPATGLYDRVNRIVTEDEIAIAQRLFFAQSPAQAWLLLAAGLVRPRALSITLPDTEIAVLAQHHAIFQREE